jgi:GTP-binding protein HflX
LRAWLVHPDIADRSAARDPAAALEEARALAAALPGIALAGAEVQPVARPRPGTLFGPGQLARLGETFRRSRHRAGADRRAGHAGAAAQSGNANGA